MKLLLRQLAVGMNTLIFRFHIQSQKDNKFIMNSYKNINAHMNTNMNTELFLYLCKFAIRNFLMDKFILIILPYFNLHIGYFNFNFPNEKTFDSTI